ncbi:MAG: ATP-binding protein [Simkania sp.]|nr:ATP-binding protein [Simkania sp.]
MTSQGYEIDFVVRDQKGNCELLQVVWDMDDVETRAREERALEEAKKELGFPGKIIDYTTYLQSQG